jgi:hypothetical protein
MALGSSGMVSEIAEKAFEAKGRTNVDLYGLLTPSHRVAGVFQIRRNLPFKVPTRLAIKSDICTGNMEFPSPA